MKIEYVLGNLVQSDEKVIAHGCNARGVMASGVAKEIRESHPKAYEDYRFVFEMNNGYLQLGSVIESHDVERTVLNIITQANFGRDPNVVYVDYEAIKAGILQINQMGYERVAFPLIGAGLANGNWKLIESIIEENSNFSPIVYILP